MNFSTVAVVVVVVALAALALFNWPALSALSPVSLGLTQVQAPLGLLLLGLTAALGLLLFVHAVLQQTRAGAEARRHAKELSVQRELADRAEASRFSELRAFLDTELRRLDAQAAEQRAATATRIDALEAALRAKVDEATRTLSAYVGEVDDKLDRINAAPR
jgi:hypothetical protein